MLVGTGLNLVSPRMLVAQDLIWFDSNVDRTGLNLVGLTLDHQFGCVLTLSCMFTWLDLHLWCQSGYDSKFFEKLWSVWITFFPLEGLSKAFIECKTLFPLTFFFQIRKHISDVMCHAMYDCAWMKCLCIRFTFMVFSFIKFANFSPMHTLRACLCSSFSVRRYFCLDACPSHHISFFTLENKNHSCSSLYIWNTRLFVFMFWTSQLSRCQ